MVIPIEYIDCNLNHYFIPLLIFLLFIIELQTLRVFCMYVYNTVCTKRRTTYLFLYVAQTNLYIYIYLPIYIYVGQLGNTYSYCKIVKCVQSTKLNLKMGPCLYNNEPTHCQYYMFIYSDFDVIWNCIHAQIFMIFFMLLSWNIACSSVLMIFQTEKPCRWEYFICILWFGIIRYWVFVGFFMHIIAVR